MAEETTVQEVPKLPTREELAATNLTKRNQEFMHQVTKLVTDVDKQGKLVQDIQAKLLVGQQSGQTAKQLFDTPANALGLVQKEQAKQQNPASNYAKYSLWQLTLDNGLAFFMLFAFMFGLMLSFGGSNYQQSAGAAGIVSLILTAVIGGFLFAVVTKNMARQGVNKFVKILTSIIIFIAWFAMYMLLAMLPNTINPVLPGWIYIILAILAFIGFRYWRSRTGIQGGFLGGGSSRSVK